MAGGRAALYWRAVRAAKPRQLIARPRRLVGPRVLALGIGEAAAPRLQRVAVGLGRPAAPQGGPVPPPHLDGVFRAVGRSRAFSPGPGFWGDRADGLLFLFALHSFDGLAAYCSGPSEDGADAFWQRVLDDWLAECANRPRLPAWHPFPTSGRLTAWCAALSRGGWPAALEARLRASAWRQTRYLIRTVEHEIGGNHVLHNAAALVIAAACLGDERIERRGLGLFMREIEEQLLADGGHLERSPSYHREVLAWVCDVISVLERAGRQVPSELTEARTAMGDWLAGLVGPDGSLPLFNDAWEGPRLEPGGEAFSDLASTGYMTFRHQHDQLTLDVAPLAPDHLPPHAHADALSLVLWTQGRPLVVDPGAGAYDGPARDWFRSTRAHATVEVDGQDQCVFWGPFRASQLPRVRRLRHEHIGAGGHLVVADHDGYTRLKDPVLHRRAVVWLPGSGVVVVDSLHCREAHRVSSGLPLAPGVRPDGGRVEGFRLEALGALEEVEEIESRYARYLGRFEESMTLRVRGLVNPGQQFGWSILRDDTQVRLTDAGLELQQPGRGAVKLDLA